MESQDPTALRWWHVKWKMMLGGTAVALAIIVLGVSLPKANGDQPKMSAFCVEIARDFHAHIPDLASEQRLVDYFGQKQWRYGKDAEAHLYYASIQAPEKGHRVDVTVRIVAGLVYEVKIRDFYVSF